MNTFTRFCIVGGFGFVVDVLFFTIFNTFMDNIMLARLVAFWMAASATWFGNRIYTYNHQQFDGVFSQWVKYILSVHFSGGINLLIFWNLKEISAIPLAFSLGILAGLLSNYFFANRFVFIKQSRQ